MNSLIPLDAPIYVSGHKGLVGSAVVRRLQVGGHTRILTSTRAELDLRDQSAVSKWFAMHRPKYVVHAAGTVGGIAANMARPAEFLYDNLMMHATVLHSAWQSDVSKLLYLGSSCIYPRECPQPIREEYLLTGPLEPTNEPYAIAKIAGVKAVQAYRRQYGCPFIAAMPTNLYGPRDNFDLETSHVLPALIRRFDDARRTSDPRVVIWGSGAPRREFLHVDDLADACIHLLERYDDEAPINVGTGEDLPISELADLIRTIVYGDAEIEFDPSRPDGMPRKLLNVDRLHALGWRHQIGLREGIEKTYRWFVKHRDSQR